MIELKYRYLYNEQNQLVFVETATKGNYKMYPHENEYNYCFVDGYTRNDGVEVRPHFSLKSSNPFALVGSSSGTGESIEHYNAIMEIVFNKSYFDTIFQERIEFDTVKAEFWQNEANKRPDISCFDKNGILIACIEIFKTNKKTPEDIEKLKKLNVPIIEININNGNKTKHLILPALLETNRERYNEAEREIDATNARIRRVSESTTRTKDEISKIIREIKKYNDNPNDYASETEERITHDINICKREIERAERERKKLSEFDPIQRLKREINAFDDKEQNEIGILERIRILRNRIQTYAEYIRFYNKKLPDTRFVS